MTPEQIETARYERLVALGWKAATRTAVVVPQVLADRLAQAVGQKLTIDEAELLQNLIDAFYKSGSTPNTGNDRGL